MAVTEKLIGAPRDIVFELLANGRTYEEWVVGAKQIRDVDAGWPEPGTRIHHTVGVGPLRINDVTKVISVDPPSRLELEALVRPTGTAHIELRLADEGRGTRVVMEESPARGPATLLPSCVTDWLIDRRNRRALVRLKDMAERRVELRSRD